jgi:hypothetical protein
MTRGWRREAAERKRTRSDEDRARLEQRITETIQEDAHAAGYHAVIPNERCPMCPKAAQRHATA